MSQDDRTAEKLSPEERRTQLRAFADRMLLKVSAMDDPEDMAGVEKAVRVAAVIERIYYRCDRAEHQTPDPRKLEAERATNKSAAINARYSLANMLQWEEQRRKELGKWWDAADTTAKPSVPSQVLTPAAAPKSKQEAPFVYRSDDSLNAAVTTTPVDSEIGPVLDTLLDDLEELTDAMAADTAYVPLRSYPPAKPPPYVFADDVTYANTKALYDTLYQQYKLKTAGASP